MKRIALLYIFIVLTCCITGGFPEEKNLFRIEGGMTQPVITYSDPQRLNYSNDNSDILRFVVYVETDYDTDLDGMPDLLKTMVQIPRAAAEGQCREREELTILSRKAEGAVYVAAVPTNGKLASEAMFGK